MPVWEASEVKRVFIMAAAGFALTAPHVHAAEASFPQKAVRIVVPFAAGGGTDLLARTLAQKLTDFWKQNVLVDNRPGGGTTIGSEMVARAAPDGHTLLLTANPHSTNPALRSKLPYDTLRDFAGVTQIASAPMIVAVHPALPVRSIRELIALAKQRPDQLSFATSGNAGPQHMAGELFKTTAGIDMVHVPYKGSAPAITDLMAGNTQLTFGSTFTVLPQAKAGRLRMLAVTTAKRAAALPELPTIAEAALPGYEATTWYGIFTTGGTPRAVVAQLNSDVVRALRLPDVTGRLTRDGSEPVGSDPAAFDAHVRAQIDIARRIVKAARMRLD
jgi:tripartite-type tricarboxylate transporter receptor subunit TctC